MSKGTSNNASADAKKRLLRDLKEIHSHPLENVTAAPVSDENLFLWHANLRGVDSDMKEIFHFILEFPTTYPLNPPTVTLCTPLPHPNVFPAKNGKGFSLCMDMLEQGQWNEDIDKKVQYSGWSSSYSIQLVLVQLQSFLLDAQFQYATQKGTLVDALAKAKAFKCTTCAHKPATPFPEFATPQQLATRTVVTVHKFVPKPRAQHMYPPKPLVPRSVMLAAAAAAAAAASAPSAPAASPAPSTSNKTPATKQTKATEPAQPSKVDTPIQPAPPAKAEWTVVTRRRVVAPEEAKKAKKDKKDKQSIAKPTPSTNGKAAPIANGKPTTNGKPVANSVNGKVNSKPKAKKSNNIVDKWAKSGAVEALEDLTPAPAPAKKEKPTFVEQPETPAYNKDYVKLMLQDAEDREAMLRERQQREKEEEKKERRKLKRQQKKAALKMNVSTTPKASAPATTTTTEQAKPNGKQAEAPAASKTAKKKANKNKKTETIQEEAKAEDPVQPTPIPAAEKKASWADDDSWEEQMPKEDPTPQAAAPVSSPIVQTPVAPTPVHKEKPSTLTYQQLNEKVYINHDKLGSLSALPLDILLRTFSHLSTAQVARISQVSTDFNKVTESGILWRELFSRQYPKSKLTTSNVADWKYVFMREVNHITDELVCYHTKLSFEEDVLGIPINFSVNPKTEKVDYISSTLDILSSTAFNKHGVRMSAYKQAFTHFLPLYISEDHFQRALPEIKRVLVALSPEYRTTGFSPNMVLSVFPKLMNTMIVLVMDGGLTASVKALIGYFAFHRLMLAFIEMYPQLMVEVNNSISEFIKSESARVKSEIPSIGDWIPLISVSNKYTWAHVAKAVIGETFDRNVIWICKQDSSLATLADISKANANNNSAKSGVEQNRLDKSFEASLVSLKLLLFHTYFLTRVARPPGVSLVQVADNYDRYFGRPNSKELDMFQHAVKKISTLRGWPDFFFLAGLPCPTPAALTTMLRENVRNSKKKRYHDDRTNFKNIHASGTSVILKKGDNFSAPSSLNKVVMGLGWGCVGSITFLDASCFECAKDGKIREVVDFSRTQNSNASITHSGDVCDYEKLSVEHTINVTLNQLKPETEILVFTITAYSSPTLTEAGKMPWVRLSDGATNEELCRYVLENTGDHTAVMMCMLRRNYIKKCWDLKVLAKLDWGRATAYDPLKKNIEKFLAGGVPDT